MKTILILSLICFALTVDSEDEKGPAYNLKHSQSEELCTDYSPFQELSSEDVPGGVSDCVDLLLWDGNRGKYSDRCCYIRFQLEGEMYGGCIGLSEENYLDITETIRRIEDGDKNLWTSETANSKVYQLDCDSSYLKFFSIASILLALIF